MRLLSNLFYLPYYLWMKFRCSLLRRKVNKMMERNRELKAKLNA